MIPELSIVIPALNEEKYLPKLLDSIAYQDFSGKLQVIVVDGQSTDNTVPVAKSFKQKIPELTVMVTEKGVGHQRNQGALQASYDYLLFLDADMVLPKNLLTRLCKKASPGKQFLSSVILWPSDGNIWEWFILFIAYPIMYSIYLLKPTCPGGFTFTTKALHKKIKGYKEGTVFGEDTDYGYRSIAAGARPKIYLDLYAFHSARRAKQMGMVGMMLFWLKYHFHVRKYGAVPEESNIKYPFGHYK